MSICLITMARLADDVAYHANAAKLLAPCAPEQAAQHIKNCRVFHAQLGELLAAHSSPVSTTPAPVVDGEDRSAA